MPKKYVATVPQIFDLWQDPQERYDIFMNNYTERTWTLVTFNQAIHDLMKTYVKYPPRKLQSEVYTGPITISEYQRFKYRERATGERGNPSPLAYRELTLKQLSRTLNSRAVRTGRPAFFREDYLIVIGSSPLPNDSDSCCPAKRRLNTDGARSLRWEVRFSVATSYRTDSACDFDWPFIPANGSLQ